MEMINFLTVLWANKRKLITTACSSVLVFIHIYPTPLLGQDTTQGQFLSGV